MSVGARNRNFGEYLYRKDAGFGRREYLNNGSVRTTYNPQANRYEDHICGRRYPSSNPVYSFHGTLLRDPSRYNLFAYNATPKEGVKGYTYPNPGNSPTAVKRIEDFGTLGVTMNLFFHPYAGRGINTAHWEVANLFRRARTEALLKVGKDKVRIGTALAEATKSWGMMVQTTSDLVRALLCVKRGDLRGAARNLGVSDTRLISGRFLEYQYGWKPLMSDIFGASESVRDALQRPPLITCSRQVTINDSAKPPDSSFRGTTTCSLDVKCKFTAQISDRYKNTMSSLGLADPKEIAWELIPFSFVVDWALPIGNLIQAMSAADGLTFVNGFESGRAKISSDLNKIQASSWEDVKPFGFKAKGFVFDRWKLSGFPEAAPYYKSPFSTEKALNAAALLRQLL